MSALSDQLTADVRKTARDTWKKREGAVVPQIPNLTLSNDRVELDAVLLYADLADSTTVAIKNQQLASEIFKSYLSGVTRIIRNNGGEVRSFDGDRVMGVFIDGAMNTNAATCGLQINWFFRNVLEAEFRGFYSEQVLEGVTFNQTVGVDRSTIHVARAGVRNDNDLIWVGRAPNIAAKLSAIRQENYNTLISADVYGAMLDSARFSHVGNHNMWTEFPWPAGVKYGVPKVYGSTWTWVAGEK